MKEFKKESGYIFGRNPVIEALQAGSAVAKVFLLFGAQGDSARKIFSLAKKNKIQCQQYDKKKFEALERSVCPPGVKSQGVIALMSLIDTITIDELLSSVNKSKGYPFIIALDGITDPQNFGAIARSAECAGASGVIIAERKSAPITPSALKASAGALQYVPVAIAVNMINALEKCKKAGFWIIGTAADAKKLYTADVYDKPVVLLIGSEGDGIGAALKKHCDDFVKIPLAGKITSLNASVSAGIIMFEIIRQRSQM